MKDWEIQVIINGDCVTYYQILNVSISEKVYQTIQNALANDKPLDKCSFGNYFEQKALKMIDFEELTGIDSERPERFDYETRAEYLEAVEAFEDEYAYILDELTIDSVWIHDPGEKKRFENKLVGRIVSSECTGLPHEKIYQIELREMLSMDCSVTVLYDEVGTIIGIGDVTAEGLQQGTFDEEEWVECYPDYDNLLKELEQELDG